MADGCGDAHSAPIVTVGDQAHIDALEGWRGEVLVKLASSMRRFGVAPRELDDLERRARAAGLTVVGTASTSRSPVTTPTAVAEVERWLAVLDTRPPTRTAARRCG